MVEAVESVHSVVSSMKDNCAEMRATLDATKAKTRLYNTPSSQRAEDLNVKNGRIFLKTYYFGKKCRVRLEKKVF